MGDFLRVFIDSIAYLWPFRIVHDWEGAGYYLFGRWWKEVKPGCYPIVPWFTDVKTISRAEALCGTGRNDITLLDGRTLSFAATSWAKVTDARLAFTKVDDPHTTAQEILASVLADKLAEEDPDRLRPRRRGRLFAELAQAVSAEAERYGLEMWDVRFTSFVLDVKTHRLLIDQTPIASW